MKTSQSSSICRRRKNASVLIIVLWIAIGMLSIALYFANSMNYELRASDNRVAGVAGSHSRRYKKSRPVQGFRRPGNALAGARIAAVAAGFPGSPGDRCVSVSLV